MITIKSEEDISLMREPCRITRDVLGVLEKSIREGMTTKELDKIAFEFIKDCGAEPTFLGYYGYPASTCISIDDMVVHGIPSDKIFIKPDSIISIDVGATKNGFRRRRREKLLCGIPFRRKETACGRYERMFFQGGGKPVRRNASRRYSYYVQTHAEANGYSVVREMVGHGVGRKMHEDPSVPNFGKKGTGIRLKKGTTLAIEPMINMGVKEVKFLADGWGVATKDGKPSAHYENTVVITDEGVEILTL